MRGPFRPGRPAEYPIIAVLSSSRFHGLCARDGRALCCGMAENGSEQDQRKARLARQLRENLKRRKAQTRSRGKPSPRNEKAR
jgi:hypothetical protein